MVRKAVAGFGPERFQTTNNITRTVKATTIEKYPSRDKFEMAHNNVSLVNFCTISPSGTNLYYYGRTVMVQNFTQPISGTNLVPLI